MEFLQYKQQLHSKVACTAQVRLISRVARHAETDKAAQIFGEAFSHRVFGSKVASVLMDTSVKGELIVVGSPELKAT